ncbi:glycosyltransferase [Shewanella gaetbuli]|uniref:Glycosyltransferase n=1 Tax=Shewanella gaetbuli TaxID=220752 RepID=A0A9X1ZGZ9_9GAMM|nr:glycosyltransferase [Shewanella gaetbuli]MCL1141563.1 glycosyltransferase [Shewanella gaetbuli]
MNVTKSLVVGNFGGTDGAKCGQTIKTHNFYTLLNQDPDRDLFKFDTCCLRNKPWLVFYLVYLIFKVNKVIILPAQGFLPLLTSLLFILRVKSDYIVIGGWLPEYIKHSNICTRSYLKSHCRIFVETNDMLNMLSNFSDYVYLFPNFKEIKKLSIEDVNLDSRGIYGGDIKFVFMSRVERTKGVLIAIDAIIAIASKRIERNFSLDIYGKVEPDFENELLSYINNSCSGNLTVVYKGFIHSDEVQSKLTEYYALIFPTYYAGEGFPGVLVDAFSAGLPVIASDWKYNSELIKNNRNGFIFSPINAESLVNTLDCFLSIEKSLYKEIAMNNLNVSKCYSFANAKLIVSEYGI